MNNVIKPFVGVSKLLFGTKREDIKFLLKEFNYETTENTNVVTGVKSTNDYYDNGMILGYLNSSFLLKYIVLTDPCDAIFQGKDLLSMNYQECLDFMKSFDNEIEEKEYVGFTSYKYGIAVYAPDATDNRESYIESITTAEKGYFLKKYS